MHDSNNVRNAVKRRIIRKFSRQRALYDIKKKHKYDLYYDVLQRYIALYEKVFNKMYKAYKEGKALSPLWYQREDMLDRKIIDLKKKLGIYVDLSYAEHIKYHVGRNKFFNCSLTTFEEWDFS